MIWVPDNTGRFRERPHYEPEELDAECEAAVEEVLRQRHGKVEYPISTEDLHHMLEQVADVDAYADFDPAEGDVWGESYFLPGETPRVRLKRDLAEQHRFENPLRTTITHEYGHIRFHGPLFELNMMQVRMFPGAGNKSWVCKRENVHGLAKRDWAEWQAGYCSGALVMPKSAIRQTAIDFFRAGNHMASQVSTGTLEEIELVSSVADRFSVSRYAATIRLKQLHYLVERQAGQRIFST